MEISADEDLDNIFQQQFDLNTCSERSFFRTSALSNEYIRTLYNNSKLHIRQPSRAVSLFNNKGHVGLIHLFLPVSVIESYRLYTNEKLANAGPGKTCNQREFFAYIGLELATSLVPLNQLRSYWSNDMFSGHESFKKVMSRNRFQAIRSSLTLKADTLSGEALSSMDPLHSCRRLLDTIGKSFSEIAVPVGTCALDEASCRSKARNRAISFMPSKPDKFAIRFYCNVGSAGPYIHSIFDNGRGNLSTACQAERYNHLHRIFGQILNSSFNSTSIIDKSSPSALWLCQLVHQSKLYRSRDFGRVVFCDNFYTRPRLAEKLLEISDGDIKMTGTCKYSNIDAINRPVILECVELLKNKPRGSWLLGRSYSYDKAYDTLRKRSNDPAIKSYKIVPDRLIQANSGFIFFKDAKVVIFYSNDLLNTPRNRICLASDDETLLTVRGTVDIERWVGTETIGRSRIKCPSIIVSYQFFMNGVDRVDQMRSTNPTKRKETKIHMSIWTYCLDLIIHQAYCVYKVLISEGKISEIGNSEEEEAVNREPLSFFEFKRRCCEQLVLPYVNQKTAGTSTATAASTSASTSTVNEVMEATVGSLEQHILLPNKMVNDNNSISCHLCNMLKKKRQSVFGCLQCGKGFHVECFAAYHHRHALTGRTETLQTIINAVEGVGERFVRKRKSDRLGSMEDLQLPP